MILLSRFYERVRVFKMVEFVPGISRWNVVVMVMVIGTIIRVVMTTHCHVFVGIVGWFPFSTEVQFEELLQENRNLTEQIASVK